MGSTVSCLSWFSDWDAGFEGSWSGFDVLVDLRLRGLQGSELFAIGALKWRRFKAII